MSFHTFLDAPPAQPLRPYVRSVRVVRTKVGRPRADVPDERHRCRVPPDGSGCLLVRLRDGGPPPRALTPDAVRLDVVGPRSAHTDFDLPADTLTIAVRFQPGALHGLFGPPGAEWVDQRQPLASLCPADANRLRTHLAHASTLSDRLSILNDVLLEWQASASAVPSTVSAAIHHFDTPPACSSPTVRGAADTVGVSTRHLRALFRTHVGLSPKTFARIKRLHRVVRAFRQRPSASWSHLAVETGFYDQAHLAADFRSLLGESPSAFRARDRQLQK